MTPFQKSTLHIARRVASAVLIGLASLRILAAAHAQPVQQPVPPAAQSNYAMEKARIAREEAAAESLFKTQEKACYQNFAVTDCINEARGKRRAKLTELRREEVAINDVERKRKAAERLQAIEDKSAPAKESKKAADRESAKATKRQREGRSVQKQEKAAAPPPRSGGSAARQAELDAKVRDKAAEKQRRAQEAAEAVQERQQREAKAKAHKEELAKRLAARKKPAPKPLPLPPA